MSICTHSKKVCRLGNILNVEGSKCEPVVVTSKQGFEPLEGEAKASFFVSINILGSVRKLGCKQQAYAHSFVNLKRKKGISATPLNWLLNAFTLALNDSAPALVCLFTK